MAIVAGFDVPRAQITFDALDRETGEVHRGRIREDARWLRTLLRPGDQSAGRAACAQPGVQSGGRFVKGQRSYADNVLTPHSRIPSCDTR